MNHSRILNNHIYRLHKRALRLVYNDFKSDNTSVELTGTSTQTIKVKNNLPPEIMEIVFSFKTFPYSLRDSTTFQCRGTKTIHYGSETISYLGPKIWTILPPEMRNIKS